MLPLLIGLEGIQELTEAPCLFAIYMAKENFGPDLAAAKSACLYRGCSQCGSQKNVEAAFSLAREAAGKSSVLGKYRLSIHLERGHGCTRDIAQAKSLLEEVASSEQKDLLFPAHYNLGCLAFNGDLGEFEGKSNNQVAVEYWAQGVAVGCVMSMTKMGVVCMLAKKFDSARVYLEAAAVHPHCPHSGLFNLGQMLLLGKVDAPRGRELIIRAAAMGNTNAAAFMQTEGKKY